MASFNHNNDDENDDRNTNINNNTNAKSSDTAAVYTTNAVADMAAVSIGSRRLAKWRSYVPITLNLSLCGLVH